MSDAVADLYIALRGEIAPLLKAFVEAGAAAERMALQVTGSLERVDAALLRAAEATRPVVVAGNSMATAWERDVAAMQAETAALEASLAKAAASAEAATAKIGGATAKAEADAAAASAASTARFTKLGMGVGLAGAVIAGAAVKMAGDFNMATTRLVTSAGETKDNLQLVRDGILAMAGSVGYSAEQLAAAMYKVESGGQHGAAGLKVLQAAAEGAKAENADLTTVADALTSAMTDYKIPADQAATTTSKLVAATSQGKMTFEELASSMSAILPVASANHVSLNDILGDLASMTVHGMSAQQASQNLADAVRQLAAPNAVAAKELASLGLNATEVSKSLGEKGLSGTINTISERIRGQMGPDGMVVLNLTNALKGLSPPIQELGRKVLDGTISMKEFGAATSDMDVISAKQAKSFATLAGSMHGIGTQAKSGAEVYQTYSGALKRAMGDATGMNVALMIGGENAGITANAIKVVSGATEEAGGHVKGWAEIQGEFNTKMAQAKDGLGALAISVGEKLLPVITPLVDILAKSAQWLASHQSAATALAIVLSGAVVVGFSAAAVAAWGFAAAVLANPIVWIVAAIVAGIALFAAEAYIIYSKWGDIVSFFRNLWDGVKAVFNGAVDAVMAPIHGIARAWNDLGPMVQRGVDKALQFIKEFPGKAGHALGHLAGELVRAGVDALLAFHRAVMSGVEKSLRWFSELPGKVGRALYALPGILVDLAVNAWRAFRDSNVAAAEALWSWLSTVPDKVGSFFKDAYHWLINAGKDIPRGLWDGFTSFISTIYHGISNFISGFINGFSDGFQTRSPSRIMRDIGTNIILGLWNGIVAMWNGFWGWATGIPGWLKGIFAGAGNWLIDAGRNLVMGLWNGIQQLAGWLWDQAVKFAQGVMNAVKSVFRPGSPSLAMTEQGMYLVQGLAGGISAYAHHAIVAAQALAGRVAGAMSGITGNAKLTVSSGSGLAFDYGSTFTPPAASGRAGGGGDVHVHVNVAGHVWTTDDLTRVIQEKLTRHGMRNVGNATNYRFA